MMMRLAARRTPAAAAAAASRAYMTMRADAAADVRSRQLFLDAAAILRPAAAARSAPGRRLRAAAEYQSRWPARR